MDTLRLAAKEMTRRRSRTLASLLCVVLGISVVVAAQTLSNALYERAKEQLLRFGANIVVQPAGSSWAMDAAESADAGLIPERYTHNVRKIEHAGMLVAVSPMLVERFQIGGMGIPVVGITAEEHKAKPWWMADEHVLAQSTPAPGQALLGHYAARHLGNPADIELGGRRFRVAATLDKTGSAEDAMAFVPLADLQEVTGKHGMVSRIEVSTSCIACPSMNINDVAADIEKQVPDDAAATPVRRIAEAQMGTLNRVQSLLRIVCVVMILLSALLLTNQASASVVDRRREIGMLLAMGMDTRRIYATFLAKAAVIGVAGGVLGFGVGTLMSKGLGTYVAGAAVSPLYDLLGYAVLASTLVCVAASMLPASRAVRIDPIQALREV